MYLCTLQESEAILSELCDSLDGVSRRMKETATYFCQDVSKFKLDELFKELLNFIKELENAIKVSPTPSQLTHPHTSHTLTPSHRRTINV